AERRVQRQYPARVQEVEDVDGRMDTAVLYVEDLAEPNIELRDPIAVHRPGSDQLRGSDAQTQRPAEVLDLVASDGVARRDLRAGPVLQRGAGGQATPGQRVAHESFHIRLKRRLDVTVQRARRDDAGEHVQERGQGSRARGQHPRYRRISDQGLTLNRADV